MSILSNSAQNILCDIHRIFNIMFFVINVMDLLTSVFEGQKKKNLIESDSL